MDTPVSAAQPETQTIDPLWFKDAVIYQLHIKSFFDGNNDGVGDIPGLISQLDYIASLGVNTLWLLPFYPSPRRDDGYDIAEYCDVHPDYGTLADAQKLIDAAHARGLRVVTELVINHTSDQHPWFQRARQAPAGSPERDFYVWSDTDQRLSGTRIIFLDTEKSNWAWDEVAGAYYWHRFYSHQPDLNFDNPAVMTAVLDVMRFWLRMGVDGLRLDAVPYLVEREGTNNENLPETHAILKRIRAALDAEFPGRMLLAEANQWPEDTQVYFGDGDECHMAFHFPLMPRMYMAIAQEDRFPITDILRQTPAIPDNCQWAIFLRNHDELTLEMVTHKERDYLWETYAPDRRARINLGIRRRLAPLVQNDRRRVELLNSLLLSMPGTPVIYYGDEIGMGDNIHLGDRDGVRTPMQWSQDRNGGFSRAESGALVLPAIDDALYGYHAVNVERQQASQHSLLNWTRRLLEVRAAHRAFGRGTLAFLYPSNRSVLVYLREYTGVDGQTESILCVVNISRASQAVELDLAQHAGQIPVELQSGTAFPPIGQLPYLLTLAPYGFFWFLLASEARMPSWYTPPHEPLPDLRTLVLRDGLESLTRSPLRDQLQNELLPPYLRRRAWYQQSDGDPETPPELVARTTLTGFERPMMLVELSGGHPCHQHHALLPLGFILEEDVVGPLPQQLAVARLRRGPEVGYLTDATALDGFARGIVQALRSSESLPSSDGELRFVPTHALMAMDIAADETMEVRRLGPPFQDAAAVGDRLVVRVVRSVMAGRHPDVELARHLTEAGFEQQLPLLGEVQRVDARGLPHTLVIAHAYRYHEGNAADRILATLELALKRHTDETTDAAAAHAMDTDAFDEALDLARRIGALAGDLHATLARPSRSAAFDYGRFDATAADGAIAAIRGEIDIALLNLTRLQLPADSTAASDVKALLARYSKVLDLPGHYTRALQGTPRMRIHGHLDPNLLLVAQGTLTLITAGNVEPCIPTEHSHCNSPLVDVAQLLLALDLLAEQFARGVQSTSASTSASTTASATASRRTALADRFRDSARRVLIEAWQATAPADCASLADTGSPLLDLYLLDAAAGRLVRPGTPPHAPFEVVQRLLDPERRATPGSG